MLIGRDGVTPGDADCVDCPHTLNDHTGGVERGYMTCDKCDCKGFCDRAHAWWLHDEEDE